MMREQQTSHQQTPRKLATRVPKKAVSKKSLNSSFSSISEDPQPQRSVDSSPISVISDIDADVIESLKTSPDSALSNSEEILLTSDFSPSSVSTTDKSDLSHVSWSVAKCGNDDSMFGSVGAEVVASFLKEARTQVLNSAGVDSKSKKLLDALVEIMVEDFHAVPHERDRIAEIVSAKSKILVLCSLLCILAMAVFLVFGSGAQSTFRGPLPT